MKNEDKALNLLRDYFPNEEFNIIKKEITMRWIDGSAWIMETNLHRIADRIYHNRPMDSGRELVNMLANAHIRSNNITPRAWRRIVNEETNYRRVNRTRGLNR